VRTRRSAVLPGVSACCQLTVMLHASPTCVHSGPCQLGRTKGTPAQRSLLMLSLQAAKVGALDPAGTVGSSRYPGWSLPAGRKGQGISSLKLQQAISFRWMCCSIQQMRGSVCLSSGPQVMWQKQGSHLLVALGCNHHCKERRGPICGCLGWQPPLLKHTGEQLMLLANDQMQAGRKPNQQ